MTLAQSSPVPLPYHKPVAIVSSPQRIVLMCTVLFGGLIAVRSAWPMLENLWQYGALRYESFWLAHEITQVLVGAGMAAIMALTLGDFVGRRAARIITFCSLIIVAVVEVAFNVNWFSGRFVDTLIRDIVQTVLDFAIGSTWLLVAWITLAKRYTREPDRVMNAMLWLAFIALLVRVAASAMNYYAFQLSTEPRLRWYAAGDAGASLLAACAILIASFAFRRSRVAIAGFAVAMVLSPTIAMAIHFYWPDFGSDLAMRVVYTATYVSREIVNAAALVVLFLLWSRDARANNSGINQIVAA